MKIAILSMQRVVNYGSFLQAYSLKQLLESYGHDIEFIDIQPGKKLNYKKELFENKKKKSLFQFLTSKVDRHFFKRIFHVLFSFVFNYQFKNCWQTILGIGRNTIYNTNYDLIVIGSDEVFNFVQESEWGFSTQLFGDFDNKMVITYAASCGFSTYEDAQNAGIIPQLKKSLNHLKFISVRDKNTFDFVYKITGIQPILHLDPTLIINLKPEAKKIKISYKYLLLYSYEGRTNSPEEILEIRAFASKKRIKVISVGTYHAWCDKNIIASPFELLSFFLNAEYIVTDTFHGTIFSIISQKKFVTIIRKTNNEKLTSLLCQFDLMDRSLLIMNELEQIIEKEIDYKRIDDYLEKERTKTSLYFSKVFKECIEETIK